eukprot:4571-Heterococcus_DN1.PRE.2
MVANTGHYVEGCKWFSALYSTKRASNATQLGHHMVFMFRRECYRRQHASSLKLRLLGLLAAGGIDESFPSLIE